MRTCQQCDMRMADDVEVCPVCGQTWSEFTPSEGRKDRTVTVVRLGIYAIVVALVVLALYWLFTKIA